MVVVTSIFLGRDLLSVLLVTTVLPPPPGNCDYSPNLLEREYMLEPVLLCEGQRGPLLGQQAELLWRSCPLVKSLHDNF